MVNAINVNEEKLFMEKTVHSRKQIFDHKTYYYLFKKITVCKYLKLFFTIRINMFCLDLILRNFLMFNYYQYSLQS